MPREKVNLVANMAVVIALTLCIGLIGAWAASRNVRPVTHLAKGVGVATPSPSPTPTPTEPPPPPSLPSTAQVVAPSTNVVWALMDYQALFVSQDQGRSWEMRTLPMPFGGVRPVISFITNREGWLLRPGVPATQCEEASADLWHTTDGAMTWQQLKVTSIDKGQCKDGIWFVDAKHGFIAAHDPNHPPTIYRTSDGGNSWTPAVLPDPPDFKSSAGGFELAAVWIKAFGSTLYLEAFDDQSDPATSHQYLFTSADGAAWAWKQKVPPRAPVMVTETRLLLLTGPGTPMESTNGGQQWHPYTTDLILDSLDFGGTTVVFADSQVGYETGSGALQRTTDGGAHWVRIATPGISQASPTAPIAACTPAASGARVSGWLTYTDTQYGFVISYPRNYTFERAGRGNPDIGWLAVYRAVDTCYLGNYAPGQVEVSVLIKPDAATLSDFVTKHSRGSCLGSGGLFYGVTNLRAVEAAGRAAVAFDEVGACAQGPGLVHSTVLILKSGFGFELDWWSVDANLTASLRDIAQQMLVSLGD